MKSMIKSFQAILIALSISCPFLEAQVTIGADRLPETYSVLQLEGKYSNDKHGGLRMPQLTTAERDALGLKSLTGDEATKANGLMIYNTDVNCVEFWNSQKQEWISWCDSSGDNGNGNGGNNSLDDYETYTGTAKISIKGTSCYDVAMTQTGTNCEKLSDRVNSFQNNVYSFNYQLLVTGATVSDVKFVYEGGEQIVKEISTAGNVGTLTFVDTVRDLIAGNAPGEIITIWALFTIDDKPYKKSFLVGVKDCFCCGENGATKKVRGSSGNLYLTHLYGADNDCWMVTNSKEGVPSSKGFNCNSRSVAGDDPGACDATRGYFYNLYQAANACPEGWRLPTNAEAIKLSTAINTDKSAAGTSWWLAKNVQAGFYYYSASTSSDQGGWLNWNLGSYYWTAEQYGFPVVADTNVNQPQANVKTQWNPVRCVKNN